MKEGERITNVTLVSPGTPASANVGDYAITPSAATGDGGFIASNYAINYSTAGKLKVNPKPLVISITADNKAYDGTATATTHATITSGLIEGHVVTVGSSNGTFNDKNAGTNKSVNADVSITGGTDAGNYTSNSTATTMADINRLALVGSFTAASKDYDGTTAATVTGYSVATKIGEEDVNIAGGTATFDTKDQGTAKTVTLAGATLTGTAKDNYSLSSVNTTMATINRLALVGSFTAASKDYDGTTAATVTGYSVATKIGEEDVNIAGGTATFDTKDQGTAKTVTLAGATLTGTAKDNYSLSSVNTTMATINRLALVGSFTAASKDYDGTTAATVTGYSVATKIGEEDVNIAGGTATFDTKDQGTDKTVTLAGATLTGTAKDNYSLSSVNTTMATINRLALVGSFTAASKDYDGTTAATVTGYSVATKIGEEDVNIAGGTATFDTKDQGTAKTVTLAGATLTGTAKDNYSLSSVNTTMATINRLALVGSFTAASKDYDGTTAATVTGYSVATKIGEEDVNIAGGTATFDTKDQGTDKTVTLAGATLTGTAKDNYSLSSVNTTTATISPKSLTITSTGPAKAYGTALTAGVSTTDFTATGMVNNESVTSVTLTPDAAGFSSTTTAGASYVVTPSLPTGTNGFIAGNYDINYTGYTGTVAKKVLTVTADAKSKTYDGSGFSSFTSTITGFVNDELVGDVVSGTVTYSGTAIAAVNAGHYTIVPVVTGLSASNYSFEAVNGTLTINSASSGGGGGGGSYDTTPPVWVTAQKALDRTVDYQDANGLIAVQALKPVASDASSFVLTKVSGLLVKSTDCIYGGTYTNTWTAKDSYGNISSVYTQVITLDKTYNDQPIIDQVKDFSVYKNSKQVEVSLSGIDPVSGCKPQEIVSLTATADNSSLVNVISVSYINGSSTGRLVLKIADNLEGESLIRVTLKDNGGSENGGSDTSEMTFKLKVVDASQGPKLSSEIPILIINPGNNFQLNLNDYFSSQNNNPVTYNATLANGTNLPSWMVFNPQTGTISGKAPQNDLGSYQIFVTSTDSQGLTTQTSFWFVNTTAGTSVVSGSLSSKTGAVTDGVEVVLLKIGTNNQTTVIEKKVLNGSSSFTFSGLSAGAYLLNAVVTDVTKHPELLNTYYNGSSSVFTAQRIELGSQNNTGIQLLMLQKAPMISSGSISGIVTRKVGPETPDNTQVGQLAPDVDVVLKQDGKIVANTLTNLDGEYSFGLLPEGTYYVEVEQLGFVLDVVKKITISANSQNAEDVNFTIWTTGTITKVNDLATSMEISMYPNPTSGQLNIVSSNYGPVTITVFNASGKETFRKNYISGEVIKINLSDNVSGFYFVKLEGEKETVIRKIILKK